MKKLLSVIIVLTLSLSLAACGSSDTSNSPWRSRTTRMTRITQTDDGDHHSNSEFTVPNFVGRDFQTISPEELKNSIGDPQLHFRYSSEKMGTIIDQYPIAGTTAKIEIRQLELTLSINRETDLSNVDLSMLDAQAGDYLVDHDQSVGVLPRVVDIYDLLADSEQKYLNKIIDEIAAEYRFDVVLLTVDGLDGKTPKVYADDFFDYGGYGFGDGRDGVLIMLSMADRDWWVSTCGYGITAFTDYGLDYISNKIVPTYFTSGDYAEGFAEFLKVTRDFLKAAHAGHPYDESNRYKGY